MVGVVVLKVGVMGLKVDVLPWVFVVRFRGLKRGAWAYPVLLAPVLKVGVLVPPTLKVGFAMLKVGVV